MSTGQWFVILMGRVVVSVVARNTGDRRMWWMAVTSWTREVKMVKRVDSFMNLDLLIL